MDGVSPIAIFVIFSIGQAVPLALALGVLALLKWGRGGWDLKDWAVGAGAAVAFAAFLFGARDLRAHYIDYVGKDGTGVLTKKWISEGEDSTTFHVKVQFAGYEDDYEINEGYWDSLTPPTNVPVRFDPDYKDEFVPTFRIASAWPVWIATPVLGLAALLEVGVLGWVLARGIDRFRGRKTGED